MTAIAASATATPSGASQPVRVGDEQRERACAVLGQALGAGYLSMPEFETRLDVAYRSHTAAELEHLLSDLPVAELHRRDPARLAALAARARLGVRIHLAAYLATTGLLVVIWLAVALSTGAWYPWPIWPALGAGLGVIAHALPVGAAMHRAVS